MISDKIAVVDFGSRSLPYDYAYLKRVSTLYKVDFYASQTLYNSQYLDLIEALDGVNVYRYAISSSVAHRFQAVLGLLTLCLDLVMRRKRYRICHLQWTSFFVIDSLLSLVFWRRFVLTVHNAVPHNERPSPIGMDRLQFLLFDSLVFVSSSTCDEFKRLFGHSKKSVIFPHGLLYLSDHPDYSVSEYLDAHDINLVFWGRVSRYKGVSMLSRISQLARLAVVGKWDNTSMSFRKSMSDGSVVLDEYISEPKVSGLLSGRRIFVLPYRKSSQSGVLYTLIAHRCVVVASDVGDFGQFYRDNGLQQLLFNYGDMDSFAAAYRYALSHYDLIRPVIDEIADRYEWSNLITDSDLRALYSRYFN